MHLIPTLTSTIESLSHLLACVCVRERERFVSTHQVFSHMHPYVATFFFY